jgi:hypothetical protein
LSSLGIFITEKNREEKYADYDGGTSDAYIEMVKNF